MLIIALHITSVRTSFSEAILLFCLLRWGLPLDQSEALLNEIWSYATADSLTWYHHWSVGDLVIWDNRCTMHRRNAFDSKSRRVMHRTQIKGR